MKYLIHIGDDEIVVTGETIEKIRERALGEISKRGVEIDDCWSEILEDTEKEN